MPVLVTDAHTSTGAAVVRRILAAGGEVRAYGAGVDDSLRAAGAIVANGDADDEGRLEAALEQVHTVIHLGPGLLGSARIPMEVAAATLATAAEHAGVQRVIALSVLGAGQGDDFRAAKGRVESLLQDADLPTVVLRVGLIVTPALLAAVRSLPADAPARGNLHAPLRLDDLLDVLAGLDDLRSTASAGHVVFHAAGPDRIQLGAWLDAQGTGRVGSTWAPIEGRSVLGAALATDAWVPGPTDGRDVFGFLGTTPRPS
ncbi:MAG: NAD(P)H-binding protein [Nitriliruptorales bacterium]|nr:NAD(P)H-binding protein [Nitriliruptorales bacterium]